MNRIIRFYNQNRKQIWRAIIIIAVVLFVIQFLNYLEKNGNNYLENASTTNQVNIIENSAIVSDKSAVSGESISHTTLQNVNDVITQFVKACNNKNTEEAYNLLSDDCKDELFPNIEDFVNSYYKDNFNTTKLCDIQNWSGSIYKVRYYEDLLSTGKSTNDTAIQDYITVVRDDDNEYKLNLNSYIGKEELNKEAENRNVRIKVVSKQKYMEYETYVIEVENKTEKTIWLDSGESSKTMYLEDDNEMTHVAYTHQIAYDALKVKSGQLKKYKIRYVNQYSSSKRINKVVFSDLILDYDEYINVEDKTNYENKINFQINVR